MPKIDLRKRELFAKEYAQSGNATAAAKAAGVPESSAHSMGYKWSRDPRVRELIHDVMNEQLIKIGPLAIGCIQDILQDRQVPAGVRLSAAKTVVGFLGNADTSSDGVRVVTSDEQIQQLTRLELEAYVRNEFGRDLTTAELEELVRENSE